MRADAGARRRYRGGRSTARCSASRAIAPTRSRCWRALSGREHEVISAVALAARAGRADAPSRRSEVRFRALQPAECAGYWDSGEPRDKAGAYAIQGLGAVFVEAAARQLFGRHGVAAVRDGRAAGRGRGCAGVAGLRHAAMSNSTACSRCGQGRRRADDLRRPTWPRNLATAAGIARPGGARPARAWRCCRRISPSWGCAMPTSGRSRSATAPARCRISCRGRRASSRLWIVGGTTPISETARRARRRRLPGLRRSTASGVARYDKIHLFDVDIPGREEKLSRVEPTSRPGRARCWCRRRPGCSGFRCAMTCAFRSCIGRWRPPGRSGSTVPAAFTVPTGRAHWETLLRARAIENLSLRGRGCAVGTARQRPRDLWRQHDRRLLGRGAGATARAARASWSPSSTWQRSAQRGAISRRCRIG